MADQNRYGNRQPFARAANAHEAASGSGKPDHYVTDKNVCNKAVSPYNANSGVTRSGVPVSPSGKLYVVKVGNVYVARDPAKTTGEFIIHVTLDSKFKVLASGLG